MNLRRSIIATAIAVLALLPVVAFAIQPGTTGTNKENQQSGFRVGVLIQKNNTATATAGAATLNSAGSGIITSEALTTISGSAYTLTLTNNMIAAADVVVATVQNGSNTAGLPVVSTVAPAAGSAVIVIHNLGGGQALNGTIKIGFWVLKQSANGSD